MKPRPPHRAPPPPSAPREPAPRDDVEVIFGLRAALAAAARRPDELLSASFDPALRREVTDLTRAMAARRLPFHEVDARRLEALARSPHHEGLCVVMRPRRWTPAASLPDVLARGRGLAVALDRVRNPYNIGAILRGAGFFGLDVAVLGAPAPHPALPDDAVRVAEGGVEHLTLARTTDLADTLQRLRARGVRVVGADGAARLDAGAYAWARPTILVMGHEREGLSERVRAQCDALVAVRGSGAVESLNVAVAAGVLFAAMSRPR